ncbi:hypothetical protein QUV97_10705 [Enterococcus cecorum]|nr:hypothetical protein [Enterococcus cecorum]MDM8184086.1 hypothetical protein [Enterococcus cecorum]
MLEMKEVYKSYYQDSENNFFKKLLKNKKIKKEVIKGIMYRPPKVRP